MQLPENQDINLSKSLTEIQSNGLDCKTSDTLSSNLNGQQSICQAICNKKSINGVQNGLANGKAMFAERCNINGDGRKPEVCNGDPTAKLDESLRKLRVESQEKKIDNRF